MIGHKETHLEWDRYWREGVESESSIKRRRFFSLGGILKIAENIMKYGRYRLISGSLKDYLRELRNEPIVDIGCGLGRTIFLLRKIGLNKTMGIDWSIEGLKVCEKNGLKIDKDVFRMDSANTSFKNGYFKLVFSEGILEHYLDFNPLVKEMARISNSYVYILQPNHFSFVGRIRIFALRNLLKGKDEAFPEISYRMEDFIKAFKGVGFDLVLHTSTFLKNYDVLLFKKSADRT